MATIQGPVGLRLPHSTGCASPIDAGCGPDNVASPDVALLDPIRSLIHNAGRMRADRSHSRRASAEPVQPVILA
jgi:hypothetical protein